MIVENVQIEQERVKLALLGYDAGMYEWDMLNDMAYYSEEWKVMLGYSDQTLAPHLSTWSNLVHPDDLETIMHHVKETVKKQKKDIETVHRLKHHNGKWIWVLGRGFIQYNQDGKPSKMVGIHTNITHQKEQEIKFRRLAQMVEQTHDSVISTDLKGIIETWNKGSEALFGYKENEVVGKSILLLQDKNDSLDFELLLRYLRKDDEFHTQTRFQTKTGKLIDVDLSLSTYKDDNKKITGIIGYSQDITQKKYIEHELANHNHNLEQYLNSIDEIDIGLFVVRENYTIQYMNNTMKKWFGDKINKICYNSITDSQEPCTYCQLHDVITKNQKVTYLPLRKDGRSFHIVAKSIINPDGTTSKMEIIRDITEIKKAKEILIQEKEALNFKANHDYLTQLPNRALFKDRLKQTLIKSKRKKTKAALLFIDLDHFKDINDTYGHDIGDIVLKEVGLRILKEIREEDTLARLGGDEFILIIEDLKQAKDINTLVKKILMALKIALNIQDTQLYISTSIGISIYPDDASNTDELIKYADIAMYHVKENGRDNYKYYSDIH